MKDDSGNIIGQIRYTEEAWTGKEWIKCHTFCRQDSEVLAFISANARFADYRRNSLMINHGGESE